jgi:hypothetical protein
VYSFGSNEHGQIGHGTVQDVLKPTLIPEGLEGVAIKSASCGTIHTAFLSGIGSASYCTLTRLVLIISSALFRLFLMHSSRQSVCLWLW